MVRKLDLGQYEVIREFKAVAGHDPIFIFQRYTVNRVANGVEGMRG